MFQFYHNFYHKPLPKQYISLWEIQYFFSEHGTPWEALKNYFQYKLDLNQICLATTTNNQPRAHTSLMLA